MSLFLGKSGNNPLLHITKGISTEAALKGPSTGSTVFHSDLPYIVVRNINDCTITSISSGYYVQNGYALSMSQGVQEDILAGYMFFMLFKRTSGSGWEMHISAPTYTNNSGVGECFSSSTVSTAANSTTIPEAGKTSYFHVSSIIGNVGDLAGTYYPLYFVEAKIFTINVKASGYVPLVKPNTSIILNNQEFSVGGVPLNTVRYLSTQAINDVDLQFTAYGHRYQIVNSVPSEGSFSLESKGGEYEIAYGGKPIFTAATNRTKVLYDSSFQFTVPAGIYTHSGGNLVTQSYVRTIAPAGTLSAGDPFIFTCSGIVVNLYSLFAVAKYTAGDIASAGRVAFTSYNSGLVTGYVRESLVLFGDTAGTLSLRYDVTTLNYNVTSAAFIGQVTKLK